MDEPILIAVSALQHYVYCPRQCGLIHLESVFDENLHTLEGSEVHDRAHELAEGTARDVPFKSGLPIWSDKLGLNGKADIVEMRPDGPYPVEYKRGRLRLERSYEVQLCAQALSLEEMLGVPVPVGALYGGASHQRREVAFDDALRAETETAARRLHALLASGLTPPADYSPKCRTCSLIEICLPRLTEQGSARRYLDEALSRATTGEGPTA